MAHLRQTHADQSPFCCVSSWANRSLTCVQSCDLKAIHDANVWECQTRAYLECLHPQLLSVVSLGQLRRILFERRRNFTLILLFQGRQVAWRIERAFLILGYPCYMELFLHALLARADEILACRSPRCMSSSSTKYFASTPPNASPAVQDQATIFASHS